MLSRRRQLVLGTGIVVALAGAMLFAAKLTIDHLLYRDAVAAGQRWAQFLALEIEELEEIAAGNEPSARSRMILEQARHIDHVYRYEVYDPAGRPLLGSEDSQTGSSTIRRLAERNPLAANAIAAGQSFAAVRQSESSQRPRYLAEAYVPVFANGRIVAVVASYVDQTEKREHYRALFGYAALSIGLFSAFAFGLPAWAWYRRTQEKLRAEEQIRFLRRHDPMTQLPNWKYFLETLQLSLAALPANGTALAIHCINLDRLKDVNNSLGREAGDAVIRKVAERLRAVIRPADMAASLGSDNFAVLQSNVTSAAAAEALAQRIRSELAGPYAVRGKEIPVSASIGIALAPAHGNSVPRLMICAQLALDRAKQDGRDRVRFFVPEMAAKLEQRIAIERAVREAISGERFTLYFQPLYCLRRNRLTGFEALLRLPGPDGELIPPAMFIPLAEEMGLIDAIGTWAMRHACRTATLWPEHLTLSVNLSPAQFLTGKVADMAEQALADSGLEPRRLALEVTESMLLSDADSVTAELARLHVLGVKIVMDDFGTGYSSLRYLWRFPFDAIKIDASFVGGLDGSDRNMEKIVTTIVALGRSLGLKVTAEGVENERQLAFLREIDCDQAQGFLFGRPMPAEELGAVMLEDYLRGLPVEFAPKAARSGAPAARADAPKAHAVRLHH